MENELMAMIFERFWHGRGVSFGMADGVDSGYITIRAEYDDDLPNCHSRAGKLSPMG